MKHIDKIELDFRKPQVMTILNVTPDSFFADSRTPEQVAIERGVQQALVAGASIIDVGGYSSRPGAAPVSAEQEWERVSLGVAVVRAMAPAMTISVDTFRSQIAAQVIEEFGRVIINDISAGELDADMWPVVAHYDVPYIAMHMRGTPSTMQSMTDYRAGIVPEVLAYFRERIVRMQAAGIREIILDPGFGFAKTTEQNYTLLRELHQLCALGYPVLAGVSRKSMIWRVLDTTPDRALAGTVALGWECLRQGATLLRVHDTQEASDSIRLFEAFQSAAILHSKED